MEALYEKQARRLADGIMALADGDVRGELINIAVGCAFAIACIDAGTMEW